MVMHEHLTHADQLGGIPWNWIPLCSGILCRRALHLREGVLRLGLGLRLVLSLGLRLGLRLKLKLSVMLRL